MRKLSVPVSVQLITKETIDFHIKSFKACKVSRVFLIGFEAANVKNNFAYQNTEQVRFAVNELKKAGFEVGFWFSSLGHGAALLHVENVADATAYTPIMGIDGRTAPHGYCPADENFLKDFGEMVQFLANLGPDIMMLDDDFRINTRNAYYYMGCFCEKHLKEYCERVGEELTRDQIKELILTGGENKYRTTYMELMRDTMFNMARHLRAKIDEVNPNIRFGTSITQEAWDVTGFDALELARIMAGENTAPFTRVAGAPYWNNNIITAVENTRLEFYWCKDSGVEIMSEGDLYPRPRYNVPSKVLELFDFMLIANNTEDGILAYMYDYSQKPEYETGYTKRYIKNEGLREELCEIFGDKKPTGIELFQVPKLFEKADLPEKLVDNIFHRMCYANAAASTLMLSRNSIPTCFEGSDYPLYIVGEHAKYVDLELLKRGAILDIAAAEILKNRGIDTGLISFESVSVDGEYFPKDNDTVRNLWNVALKKIECDKKAEVLSRFMPSDTPASYRYENGDGMRFLVFAFEHYGSGDKPNYFNNYYRQAQIIDTAEWMGKKLPAVCPKNPNLFILAAKNNEAMSVMLANVYLDDVLEPEVVLDKEYSEIKFVNCSGKLMGDKVVLSDIAPYGFAAFEVK